MGLRPSVKNDDNIHYGVGRSSGGRSSDTNSSSQQNYSSMSHNDNDHGSSQPSGGGNSTPSSPSPPPQREAWTTRGQLLLNFHHAISKAINSPEMIRKCDEIARDMQRVEMEEQQQGHQPTQTQQQQHGQHNINGIANTQTAAARTQRATSVAEEYSAEAALIVSNKSKRDALVRNKSLALGLFTFVALRSTRGLSAVVRKALANRGVGSYKFDGNRIGGSGGPSVSTSVAANKSKGEPSTLRKVLRLSFDLTLSTTVSFLSATFLFVPRPTSYIEDMSQLPLVEGKSVYAEMVCPPLLQEYKKVLEKYGGRWPVLGAGTVEESDDDKSKKKVPGLTQEDVSLNVIRTFVENCSKRSKYERALLEERNALSKNLNENSSSSAVSRLMRRLTERSGVNEDMEQKSNCTQADGNKLGTVSIPSPGVPKDVEVDLDLDVFTLAADEGSGDDH